MEINPKLSLVYKEPHGLFKASVLSPVAHFSDISLVKSDLVKTIKVYVHKYQHKKKTINVVCLNPHYDCPHCILGELRFEVNYAIDIANKQVYYSDTIGVPASKEEVCLLCYTTKHKHPYDLTSFTPLAVYPLSWLTYHDLIIVETNKLAKKLLCKTQ